MRVGWLAPVGLALGAALLLAGCAAPIGRNGEPIGLGQAICESLPGTRCCAHRPPSALQPYCTRSLGTPDCWSDPGQLNDRPHMLTDTPTAVGCS